MKIQIKTTTKNNKNDKQEFALDYIDELYIIEKEIPELLTKRQKKELQAIKNGPEKFIKSLYNSHQQIIKAIYELELKPPRELKEVQFLWASGDPTQLIELVNSEIKWIKKNIDIAPGIPRWIDTGYIETIINKPRYKNDPLGFGGYWLLFLAYNGKRKSSGVILWWQNLYLLSEILSDKKYIEKSEQLKCVTTQLVDIINELFPPSKPWKFREKIDSKTLIIVKKQIYESLLNYIQNDYPDIEIKTGKANGIIYHRIDPQSKHYNNMLTSFFDNSGLPEEALTSLLENNVVGSSRNNPSITLRNISNTIVESIYGISEKTNRRKSKKT